MSVLKKESGIFTKPPSVEDSRWETYQAAINDETKRIPAQLNCHDNWNFCVEMKCFVVSYRNAAEKVALKSKQRLSDMFISHSPTKNRTGSSHLKGVPLTHMIHQHSTRRGPVCHQNLCNAPMWTSNWGFWWSCLGKDLNEPEVEEKTVTSLRKQHLKTALYTSAKKNFSWTESRNMLWLFPSQHLKHRQ